MTTEKEPTQEELQKFWEWCGFKPYLDKNYYAEPPRTLNGWIRDGEPPERFLPTLDLNNLFKYAVPKLQDKGKQVEIMALEHKGFDATVYKKEFSRRGSDGCEPYLESIHTVRDDKPELALLRAIQEAIK